MLIATKIENNSYTFPKERVDFSTLVEDVLQRIRQNLPEKERLQASLEAGIQLQGDRFALSLALSNLADNALKYSPSDSVVNVSLNKTGHKPTLKIADQGPGIRSEEHTSELQSLMRISQTV